MVKNVRKYVTPSGNRFSRLDNVVLLKNFHDQNEKKKKKREKMFFSLFFPAIKKVSKVQNRDIYHI